MFHSVWKSSRSIRNLKIKTKMASIKCIQWNCRGVKNKYIELSNLSLQLNLVCLQETWLHRKDFFEFDQCTVFREDRPDNFVGGEIAIICRNLLDPITHNITDLTRHLGIKATYISVKNKSIPDGKMYVISLYKPPSICINKQAWQDLFYKLKYHKKFNLLICGDFNAIGCGVPRGAIRRADHPARQLAAPISGW